MNQRLQITESALGSGSRSDALQNSDDLAVYTSLSSEDKVAYLKNAPVATIERLRKAADQSEVDCGIPKDIILHYRECPTSLEEAVSWLDKQISDIHAKHSELKYTPSLHIRSGQGAGTFLQARRRVSQRQSKPFEGLVTSRVQLEVGRCSEQATALAAFVENSGIQLDEATIHTDSCLFDTIIQPARIFARLARDQQGSEGVARAPIRSIRLRSDVDCEQMVTWTDSGNATPALAPRGASSAATSSTPLWILDLEKVIIDGTYSDSDLDGVAQSIGHVLDEAVGDHFIVVLPDSYMTHSGVSVVVNTNDMCRRIQEHCRSDVTRGDAGTGASFGNVHVSTRSALQEILAEWEDNKGGLTRDELMDEIRSRETEM